jgi:hypothetical protein
LQALCKKSIPAGGPLVSFDFFYETSFSHLCTTSAIITIEGRPWLDRSTGANLICYLQFCFWRSTTRKL